MKRTKRAATVGAAVALAAGSLAAGSLAAGSLSAGMAAADDAAQHNVTYRARIDGLARGAVITYRLSDAQINSAVPTMLPGRTFEATAVLTDPRQAGMRISIQWPYSANLHCEILVDDEIVVQADQVISPKLTPARDDPDYGAMNCGSPLSNALGTPASAAPSTPLPGAGEPSDMSATDPTAPVN